MKYLIPCNTCFTAFKATACEDQILEGFASEELYNWTTIAQALEHVEVV